MQLGHGEFFMSKIRERLGEHCVQNRLHGHFRGIHEMWPPRMHQAAN